MRSRIGLPLFQTGSATCIHVASKDLGGGGNRFIPPGMAAKILSRNCSLCELLVPSRLFYQAEIGERHFIAAVIKSSKHSPRDLCTAPNETSAIAIYLMGSNPTCPGKTGLVGLSPVECVLPVGCPLSKSRSMPI
jgi:hypothetical protein